MCHGMLVDVRGQLVELVLAYLLGSENWTHAIRLWGKHFLPDVPFCWPIGTNFLCCFSVFFSLFFSSSLSSLSVSLPVHPFFPHSCLYIWLCRCAYPCLCMWMPEQDSARLPLSFYILLPWNRLWALRIPLPWSCCGYGYVQPVGVGIWLRYSLMLAEQAPYLSSWHTVFLFMLL